MVPFSEDGFEPYLVCEVSPRLLGVERTDGTWILISLGTWIRIEIFVNLIDLCVNLIDFHENQRIRAVNDSNRMGIFA